MESLKGNVRYSFCRILISLEYVVTQNKKHRVLLYVLLQISEISSKIIRYNSGFTLIWPDITECIKYMITVSSILSFNIKNKLKFITIHFNIHFNFNSSFYFYYTYYIFIIFIFILNLIFFKENWKKLCAIFYIFQILEYGYEACY